MTETTHVAEIAVPGQSQITIRLSHGEIELGQEYDFEDRAIYVRPENVLTLIRSLLCMIGLDDAHLYREGPRGCYDIDWPDGPFTPSEVAVMTMRPDIDWGKAIEDFNESGAASEEDPISKRKDRTAAERQRRYRERKRNGATSDVTSDAAPQLIAE